MGGLKDWGLRVTEHSRNGAGIRIIQASDFQAGNLPLASPLDFQIQYFIHLQQILLTHSVCQDSVINKRDMEGEAIPDSGKIRKASNSER